MDEYLGTIKLFAGNYAPIDWAFCDGTMLIIVEHQDLFNVIGNTYGGDGINNFALPDLRARVPMGAMTSKKGTIPLGQTAGEVSVTLTKDQTGHTHTLMVSNQSASKAVPGVGSAIGAPNQSTTNYDLFAPSTTPDVPLNGSTIDLQGGSFPHNNMQPYLGMNYIICINGVKPS